MDYSSYISFVRLRDNKTQIMTKKEIKVLTEKVYKRIIKHYGKSKYHIDVPFVAIESSPYSDADVDEELYGEYCFMMNEITLYWKNIKNIELLARTLVHEYQHYLQSPAWMTRYYTMGYDYNDHPYEVQAFDEEEKWLKFL